MLRRVSLSRVALAACGDDIEIPQLAQPSTGAATDHHTTDSGATTAGGPLRHQLLGRVNERAPGVVLRFRPA